MSDSPQNPPRFTSLYFGEVKVCIQDDTLDAKVRDERAFQLLKRMTKELPKV